MVGDVHIGVHIWDAYEIASHFSSYLLYMYMFLFFIFLQKFSLESEDSVLTSTLKQFASYLDDVSV